MLLRPSIIQGGSFLLRPPPNSPPLPSPSQLPLKNLSNGLQIDAAINRPPRISRAAKTMGGRSGGDWLRQSLGQRLNLAGVAFFLRIISTEEGRRLALPHLSVPDIRWVDWGALEKLGFRGVVFDKDNTLTSPYSLSLWPPIASSLDHCLSAFPRRVAIYSNSAGLSQYDPDGLKAMAVEESIQGIHVIRHATKKPAGTVEEIEQYFGCSSSQLIMVGDRCLTDVVYGNRNGFLTILTEPFNVSQEPFIVRLVRKLEKRLLTSWRKKGLKPLEHSLFSDWRECTKTPTL